MKLYHNVLQATVTLEAPESSEDTAPPPPEPVEEPEVATPGRRQNGGRAGAGVTPELSVTVSVRSVPSATTYGTYPALMELTLQTLLQQRLFLADNHGKQLAHEL